ncbi:LRCH3 family protein [Megaselia abdita]
MKMAVKLNQKPGTGTQNHLTRSLEKILEEAHCSGELSLSNRKLKDFPKPTKEYNLSDTIIADLSRNRFCELPEEVTDFSFMETLLLYHNGIRSISPSIKSLTSLTYLDLRSNQLTSLPREVCFLPLHVLLVSNNRLTSLPDDLGRMERLTDLDASYNQLTTLPARIGDLRSLRSFSLRSNQLMYLPRELTYLSLVSLDVSSNRISSLPTELRQMTTLTEFNLEHNPMTSPPASLCVRGLVHVFKFLETQATKDERGKSGGNYDGYTTLRRTNRTHSANVADTTTKPNRQNPEFNYNIGDNVDKRWSSDVPPASKTRTEIPATSCPPKPIENFHLDLSNPLSPSKQSRKEGSTSDVSTRTETPTYTNSNSSTGSGASFSSSSPEDDIPLDMQKGEEKNTSLENIQTYREYKEALKQQRNHDVYKPKNNQSKNIFEINENVNNLPEEGSAENVLVTNGNNKNAFHNEDAIIVIPKKPVQKVIPSRNVEILSKDEKAKPNGDSSSGGYVKPSSPMKSNNSGGTNGILTSTNNKFSLPNSNKSVGKSSTKTRSVNWSHDIPPEKLSFTMRREFDKHKEEAELITQLRSIIENRLKMSLPEDIASALTDGVILCHLANYVRPRSVASIHVPTPGVVSFKYYSLIETFEIENDSKLLDPQTKLTMARCRRNVDNFLEACRKIGVDENLICCSSDVLEGKGAVQVAITVSELFRLHAAGQMNTTKSPTRGSPRLNLSSPSSVSS